MGLNSKEKVSFNGIKARTGSYLFEPMSANDISKVAQGNSLAKESADKEHLRDLKYRNKLNKSNSKTRGVKQGINAAKLEQAGWGVMFPATRPGSEEAKQQEAILEALSPLLELRKAQATKLEEHYYKEYRGKLGYRPGESKQKYMGRLGVGIGPADPDQVPYYLLIVGSPQTIPFRVQYQIDVQYAVGRIYFDTLEEYDNYARSVVAAETEGLSLAREIAFVGVQNPDDAATRISREHLVGPLADMAESWTDVGGWSVTRHFDDAATKASVARLLGGPDTPALLFSASHGMGFDRGDPLQRRHQGALLMQDWTGPEQWRGPIGEELYISGDDLRSDAGLGGMIAFNFACYGGGTPQYDEFAKQAFKEREAIADEAFVAGLHRRMLAHPKRGALAAIGHIERAWGCSFMSETGRGGAKTRQLAVFESTLKCLMKGMTVGMALEYFNERYAEMASDLSVELEDLEDDPDAVDPFTLANMWTSNNDARGYAILGDPAVRLCFAEGGGSSERPVQLSSSSETSASTTLSLAVSDPERGDKLAAALRRALRERASGMKLDVRVGVDAGAPGDGLGVVTRVRVDAGAVLLVETRSLAPVDEGGGLVDAELMKLHLEIVERAHRVCAAIDER